MRLAVVVGSLRRESYNRILADVIVGRLAGDIEVIRVDASDVPFMNEDLETNLPGSVQRVAQQVTEADGLLIISPEYNRGIPAVTKNIVDWLSRESTGNPLKSKPVAIGGISSGPIKTLVMQSQLRPVLAHTQAHVMTAPVLGLTIGDANMMPNGTLSETTSKIVDAYVASMVQHIKLYTEEV